MRQDRTFPDCVSNKECERSKMYRIKALQTQLLSRICNQWAEGRTVVCYASDWSVDSGADVSTLDIELYRSMVNPPDLRQTSDTLSGAGGEIECYGKFRTTTKFKNQEYAIDVYVINGSNLLGRTDASASLVLFASQS